MTGSLPTLNVAVNHFAVKYVTLHHGNLNDTGRGPCYAATLALNVTIPAGVASTPYFFANTNGSSPQALSVSGSTASITVPWNTCSASPDGYLSLPNDSLGLDGREFVITGKVTVDLNSPSAPSDPAPGTIVVGPVVAAPTSDPAPTLTLYAPELLRVNSRDRLLRFIVFAGSSGKLRATLGSVQLGTSTLRAGDNDIRYKLPAMLVTSLRRTAANNVLSLTSLSPSGSAGTTITHRVVIVAPKRKHR